MGLESFKRYQDLCKRNYFPPRIGFGPKVDGGKVKGGDINRLNARIRLAKDCSGMKLGGYDEKTAIGYDGFLRVFLTHSALERFMEINALKNYDELFSPMAPYGPERVVDAFFDGDDKDKLYNFLLEKIDREKLREGFRKCKRRESANVARISAAVRNIFAHGHLTANTDGINPKKVHKACTSVSEFLLRFMDAEFTKKIDACYDKIAAKETANQNPAEDTS